MTFRLNRTKWNELRLPIEQAIKNLKARIWVSGYQMDWSEARELNRLKDQARKLYMLRAHLRGHLHIKALKRFNLEAQKAIAVPVTMEEQQKAIEGLLCDPTMFVEVSDAVVFENGHGPA